MDKLANLITVLINLFNYYLLSYSLYYDRVYARVLH